MADPAPGDVVGESSSYQRTCITALGEGEGVQDVWRTNR